MQPNPNAPPLNPLPGVVWLLALPIIAIELVLGAAARGFIGGAQGVGWRLAALQDYSVSGAVLRWMVETGRYTPDLLLRFVSYPFVHLSFTHALFVVVFLLALGKMVGEVFRPWAVLVVFFGAAITGALVYALLFPEGPALAGGFPAVYGLIGAFTFLLWVNLAAVGANQYRAFTLIGFLLGFQLIFGLLFGSSPDWVADIAGFVAGFGLSFLVSPGGWSRVRARLRHR